MVDCPDVNDALAALHADDPGAGRLAEEAFGSLTWGEGLESITQIGLQEYLWYQLPANSAVSSADKRGCATALGALFSRLGMDRYAAICGSETTHAVIGAYESGRDKGLSAYRGALAASGVEPPALPELAWSRIMGTEEAAAYYVTAGALELAQAAGLFRVGTRGWRGTRRRVAVETLTRAQPEHGGACWLERVHEERLDGWAHGRSATRTVLIGPIVGLLRAGSAIPDDAAIRLGPARWLLAEAAAGITLTQRGNLPPSLVAAMNDAYGFVDLAGHRPRAEHEVPALTSLRELARGAGLIRRTGRRLVLSPVGRRIRADVPALWNAVTGRLAAGEDLQAAVAEIALLILAAGRPVGADRLTKAIADAVAEDGWHDSRTRDTPPDIGTIAHALLALRHRLRALNLLVTERTPASSYQLDRAGRVAALGALRARALRPRTVTGP